MKQQIEWIRGAIAAVLGLIALIMIVSTLLGAMESPPEWTGYPGPYPEPYPAADAYPAYLPVAPSAPTVEPSYP